MSILETFYILFKGDNTDVKKSAKESEHAVQSLQDALTGTFKKVDQATQKTGQSFLDLAKAAAGFVGATAAAYTTFHKILGATEYANQLGNISKALNVNVSDLDAWSQAVKRTGGSAEGFQNSLRSLAQHFGVSGNIALKVLPKLADVFKRIGNYRAQYYGKALGLDEATILLLQQGRREIESITRQEKDLGVVTQKDTEIAKKYTLANIQLSLAFRGLYLTLAQSVVPVLTEFYKILVPAVEYIRNHKDLVIGAFIGIGIAAAVMLAPFLIANAAIISVGIAIATLIGLFAIAYEDIKAYIQGNQSLTGDILKRWSNVKTLFEDVFKILYKISTLTFPALAGAEKIAKRIGSLFGFGNNNDLNVTLPKGKTLIQNINDSPLGYQSPASRFLSSGFDRNLSINTGDLIINTQANDAVGISKDIIGEFRKQLAQANNNFSNGAAY